MDALSSIFSMMKLSSTIYFRSDFKSPWGMESAKSDYAQFHMVASGNCVVDFSDGEQIQLNTGDILLIPHGDTHIISDASHSNIIDGMTVVKSIQSGNSPFKGDELGATTLICGHFEFDKTLEHPFIKELPRSIYITDLEHREQAWFETVYNLILNESLSGLPGSNVVMTRLAEVMLMHILRTFILREQNRQPYYATFNDSQLSQSLKKIHQDPSYAWSLISLAKEAGMSRTLFATKFKSMLGSTPMEYVTQWRMLKAKELLTRTQHPIAEVAEKVGYSSEASFNRAFKRISNTTPLVFRKSA